MSRIAVVGGGLIGVSSAFELQRSGFEVTLFETANELAQGTSYANGGLLSASLPDPWNDPGVGRHLWRSLFDASAPMKLHWHAIPKLSLWGLRFLLRSAPSAYYAACQQNYALTRYSVDTSIELAAELDLDFSHSDRGILKIVDRPEALSSALTLAQALQCQGLEWETLGPDECINHEPALAEIRQNIHAGVFFPNDHSGDARHFTQGLGEQFVARGGTLRHGETVQRIHIKQGRVQALETDQGEHAVEQVVVAAGVDSTTLLRPLGIHLPIQPAKGYSLSIPIDNLPATPQVAVVDAKHHVAITPLGDHIRVAGTAEFMGFSRALESHRVENLHQVFAQVYPQIATAIDPKVCSAWTGLRPMTFDGKPRIGAVGPQGLFVNAGHGPLGWTMASGSARLLAAVVSGGPMPIDPAPFQIS